MQYPVTLTKRTLHRPHLIARTHKPGNEGLAAETAPIIRFMFALPMTTGGYNERYSIDFSAYQAIPRGERERDDGDHLPCRLGLNQQPERVPAASQQGRHLGPAAPHRG